MWPNWTPRRVALGRIRQFVGLLLAILIGWCSAAQYSARTPEGVQCPTARVQTVAVPILTKCGHLIGYEKRAPKPGEKNFVQCRCAEKRSSQPGSLKPPNTSLPDMLPLSDLALSTHCLLPEFRTDHPYLARTANLTIAPPTPPPAG